jgi:hypothetical protein
VNNENILMNVSSFVARARGFIWTRTVDGSGLNRRGVLGKLWKVFGKKEVKVIQIESDNRMDITAKVLNGFWNERVRIQLRMFAKQTSTCGKQTSIEPSESHATFSSSGCHRMSRGKTSSLDRMESIMLTTRISSGRFRWLWFSFCFGSSLKGGEGLIGF